MTSFFILEDLPNTTLRFLILRKTHMFCWFMIQVKILQIKNDLLG